MLPQGASPTSPYASITPMSLGHGLSPFPQVSGIIPDVEKRIMMCMVYMVRYWDLETAIPHHLVCPVQGSSLWSKKLGVSELYGSNPSADARQSSSIFHS